MKGRREKGREGKEEKRRRRERKGNVMEGEERKALDVPSCKNCCAQKVKSQGHVVT